MWSKATGEDSEAVSHSKGTGRGKTDGELEDDVSIFEIINTLIAHGHKKHDILNSYSRDEMILYYEKCIKYDVRAKADFIESVIAGIGGAFGDGKQIEKLLTEMRK